MQQITTGPDDADVHLILAHGAGAPMTSEFMQAMANVLALRSVRVTRFNFAYMESIVGDGRRLPPPGAEKLTHELQAFVASVSAQMTAWARLYVGGKSMGGRIATLIADELWQNQTIAGVVCLGYPFHPPGKPEKVRTAHLGALSCPTLIIQGERDALGNRQDVAQYDLANTIELRWCADGDHDLRPRKRSGVTWSDNLKYAAEEIGKWCGATDIPELQRR